MEFLLQLFSYSNNSFVFFLKEPQRHVSESEKKNRRKKIPNWEENVQNNNNNNNKKHILYAKYVLRLLLRLASYSFLVFEKKSGAPNKWICQCSAHCVCFSIYNFHLQHAGEIFKNCWWWNDAMVFTCQHRCYGINMYDTKYEMKLFHSFISILVHSYTFSCHRICFSILSISFLQISNDYVHWKYIWHCPFVVIAYILFFFYRFNANPFYSFYFVCLFAYISFFLSLLL